MQMTHLQFYYEFRGQPIPVEKLAQLSTQLKDATDSADYYYTLGLYYSTKETYDRDSLSICYYLAAQLDSTDVFLQLQLVKWLMEEEEYEEAEDILLQAIPRFNDEEKGKLQEQLANIYLDTERYAEAFSVCRDLVQAGYLFCSDLQKMKKAFKGLKEYETFMKNCKEDN